MIAASLANMTVGGGGNQYTKVDRTNSSNAKSNKSAAKSLNVGTTALKDAKNLKRDAPDLAEKVSRGRARKSKANVTIVTIAPTQEDHTEAPEKHCKSR